MSARVAKPTRRALLAGAGAGLLLPAGAPFAATGARRFTVFRDGDAIGVQSVEVRASANGEVEVAVDVKLRVKILGITAYRYDMSNRERWRGGRLLAMDSRTDDDGDTDFARAEPAGDALQVEGSAWSGTLPGDAVTTTYWARDFLDRKTWINSQTGEPIEVGVTPLGAGEAPGADGPIATDRWRVAGEGFDVVIHYQGEEWVSIEFEAGGEPAIYRLDALGGAFAPVWARSL